MTHATKTGHASHSMLIVDDHMPTVGLIADLLGRAFPELVICTALTSAEAMAICSTRPPRVVIMDIGLPDVNGIDTARLIKASWSSVTVVMHTNHDHEVYEQGSVLAGADAFVSKARTYEDLVPAIGRLLGSLPATAGDGSGAANLAATRA